jgi:hypothetical protein
MIVSQQQEVQPEISFTVDLQPRDIHYVSFANYYSTFFGRAATVVALLGLALWLYAFIEGHVLPTGCFSMLFGTVVGAIAVPLLGYISTERQYRRLQDFQRTICYTFTSTGFDCRDEKSLSRLDWSAIQKA